MNALASELDARVAFVCEPVPDRPELARTVEILIDGRHDADAHAACTETEQPRASLVEDLVVEVRLGDAQRGGRARSARVACLCPRRTTGLAA